MIWSKDSFVLSAHVNSYYLSFELAITKQKIIEMNLNGKLHRKCQSITHVFYLATFFTFYCAKHGNSSLQSFISLKITVYKTDGVFCNPQGDVTEALGFLLQPVHRQYTAEVLCFTTEG